MVTNLYISFGDKLTLLWQVGLQVEVTLEGHRKDSMFVKLELFLVLTNS